MEAVFRASCCDSSLIPCSPISAYHHQSRSGGVGLPPLPPWSLRPSAFGKSRSRLICAATPSFEEDLGVPRLSSDDPVDQQQGLSSLVGIKNSNEETPIGRNLGGFSPDPPFTFDFMSAAASSSVSTSNTSNNVQVLSVNQNQMDDNLHADRVINALIVGAAGAFAAMKILTVDHDYWHGWTLFEILMYAPLHNWSAYEEALKSNPVLAKMMISGIVYSLGDWIAQCYEGKPILDFNRKRMMRSGLVGFCLHGSLSHYYYHVCEALFPYKDWWVVPLKVAFDQTMWSGFWNSVYFVVLGMLRFESPITVASELTTTFWRMLTAGWKLWPFAHLITYGLIPVEQRLLWVDCVELVWVTILSMYSNEKAEARILEAAANNATNENMDTAAKGADVLEIK